MDFDLNLGIERERISVGESELELITPTLHQVSRLANAISELHIERFQPILEAASKGEGGISAVVDSGALSIIQDVLGNEFFPTVLNVGTIMLDTKNNARVVSAVIEGELKKDHDNDGVYLGSPQVRCFIKSNLTLAQGITVLLKSWEVSGLSEAVGKLFKTETQTEN